MISQASRHRLQSYRFNPYHLKTSDGSNMIEEGSSLRSFNLCCVNPNDGAICLNDDSSKHQMDVDWLQVDDADVYLEDHQKYTQDYENFDSNDLRWNAFSIDSQTNEMITKLKQISPECRKAINRLCDHLPKRHLYIIQNPSTADMIIQDNLFFSYASIKPWEFECSSYWKWNQSRRKTRLICREIDITYCKYGTVKYKYVSKDIINPHHKIWVMEIEIRKNQERLWFFWCEKGCLKSPSVPNNVGRNLNEEAYQRIQELVFNKSDSFMYFEELILLKNYLDLIGSHSRDKLWNF